MSTSLTTFPKASTKQMSEHCIGMLVTGLPVAIQSKNGPGFFCVFREKLVLA